LWMSQRILLILSHMSVLHNIVVYVEKRFSIIRTATMNFGVGNAGNGLSPTSGRLLAFSQNVPNAELKLKKMIIG